MISQWLKQHSGKGRDELIQPLREMMQEIALVGLYRSGFFEKAAFYGGTALRIFYQLPRYSEDLDFSLLSAQPDFKFDAHLEAVVHELHSLGMRVSVKNKTKSIQTPVESAFLKAETYWKELVLEDIDSPHWQQQPVGIKIKLEIDREPPLLFKTEEKLLLRPFSCYIKCFVASDLFAGKMHALLFRKWKNRVKGRDWFDFEWYIRQGIPINLEHLTARAQQSGDWPHHEIISQDALKGMLAEKLSSTSIAQVKDDVRAFVPNAQLLNIWEEAYFKGLINYLKFV